MALLSVIRRWHFRERISLREIAKRTGLSRNTIRRYLRGNVVEPAYPVRKTPNKLDGFAVQLAEWLKKKRARAHRDKPMRRWDGISRRTLRAYDGNIFSVVSTMSRFPLGRTQFHS